MAANIRIPEPGMKWHVRLISRTLGPRLTELLGGLYVGGSEHIPDAGPALLCANHVSYFDPPLLAFVNRERRTCFMAKDGLFKIPLMGPFLGNSYVYPVDRDDGGRQAIRIATQLLEAGELVAIYPEGTRSPDGELLPGKPGAALIASRTGAPIVPIGTWGTDIVLPRRSKRLYRCPIYVCIGKPLAPPSGPGGKRPTKEALRTYTEDLMGHIARLKAHAESLVPDYWRQRAAAMKSRWQAMHAEEIARERRELTREED